MARLSLFLLTDYWPAGAPPPLLVLVAVLFCVWLLFGAGVDGALADAEDADEAELL